MPVKHPNDIGHERKKRQVLYIFWGILFGVGVVDVLILGGVGGPGLIAALEANGTWAVAALGVYLVVFELERVRPPPPEATAV